MIAERVTLLGLGAAVVAGAWWFLRYWWSDHAQPVTADGRCPYCHLRRWSARRLRLPIWHDCQGRPATNRLRLGEQWDELRDNETAF